MIYDEQMLKNSMNLPLLQQKYSFLYFIGLQGLGFLIWHGVQIEWLVSDVRDMQKVLLDFL